MEQHGKTFFGSNEEFSFPRPLAGVDEVGRGALAGPVLAVATILPHGVPANLEIADSKTLTPVRREASAAGLREIALFGVGAASARAIDNMGILPATMLAMRRAIFALPVAPAFVLVDGTTVPPGLPCQAAPIVRGDASVLEIAASSILAKVIRDLMMKKLAARYSLFSSWARNSGYGTADHFGAIDQFGPTRHHRLTFLGKRFPGRFS